MHYDEELKYCPRCQDEYRAEITQCANCQVELVSGRDMASLGRGGYGHANSRLGELTTDDDIVTIHKGPMLELKKFEQLFGRENIGMRIVGEGGGCNKGCCASNFLLQVRRDDAAAALSLIAQDFREQTGLDDYDTSHSQGVFDENAGQATCPACGFEFETSTTTCPDCGLCFA